MATEGKELQIVYDAVCFVTNICIAYILYLSNGGTNNKITRPTLHSLNGHGSQQFTSEKSGELRCDISNSEAYRSYSLGNDIEAPQASEDGLRISLA